MKIKNTLFGVLFGTGFALIFVLYLLIIIKIFQMTQDTIYFNPTTSGGKYTIYTKVKIKGRGITFLGGQYNVNLKGDLLKGFYKAVVTKKALDKLKINFLCVKWNEPIDVQYAIA